MLSLPDGSFTLSWTHSVERTEWREDWRIAPDGLHLVSAAVQGSGAGMEAGPDARKEGAWWIWEPDLPTLPRITLAASGATGGGWTLCSTGACQEIGMAAQAPIILQPCP